MLFTSESLILFIILRRNNKKLFLLTPAFNAETIKATMVSKICSPIKTLEKI